MPDRADQSLPSEWEQLNAFADGELAPADQRAVAARLAASLKAAETLRGIVRLKQELQALPAEDTPPMPALARPPQSRWRGVAAIAAALLLATTVAFAPMLMRTETSEAFLATSLAAHERFATATPLQSGAPITPATISPVANELIRLGLQPVWQASSATGQARIGFIGTRGCRLSLHASPRAEAISLPEQAGTAMAGWHAGSNSYLLIATGMPSARFEMIAGFIKALTTQPAEAVAPLRSAMQNDWRTGQPCLA